MKLKYHAQVDAAYLSIVPSAPGLAKRTYPCDPEEVGSQIQLDFDEQGRLIGIEVLQASGLLPREVLKASRR